MDEIIQLKISLNNTKPPIWRRVLVEKHTSFFELHLVMQFAMGWDFAHLYEFEIDHERISEKSEEDIDFDPFADDIREAKETFLDDFMLGEGVKFKYWYDFGDDWKHTIVIEKLLPRDASVSYPVCTGGKRQCPPEDCGGVWGFNHLLEVLDDEKHPDHKEMLEWIGSQFDPEYFDIKEVNHELADVKQYVNRKFTDDF
ncbi:MAG: plasmid pRiA4b ORF-3 family protein [Bacteroidales bacterium]|nr:plasmid pRiA4b ORF-3 family protein [Bacteroidales bacterium]MDD3664512.1 plasmid pRiA4b ORF-3 family protein [Bacteroidales bacterium]